MRVAARPPAAFGLHSVLDVESTVPNVWCAPSPTIRNAPPPNPNCRSRCVAHPQHRLERGVPRSKEDDAKDIATVGVTVTLVATIATMSSASARVMPVAGPALDPDAHRPEGQCPSGGQGGEPHHEGMYLK